jgi:hypothetical protein
MHIFKQIFRIRMTWFFLSSELYIKDTHGNGVKFSNDDYYIIWCIGLGFFYIGRVYDFIITHYKIKKFG